MEWNECEAVYHSGPDASYRRDYTPWPSLSEAPSLWDYTCVPFGLSCGAYGVAPVGNRVLMCRQCGVAQLRIWALTLRLVGVSSSGTRARCSDIGEAKLVRARRAPPRRVFPQLKIHIILLRPLSPRNKSPAKRVKIGLRRQARSNTVRRTSQGFEV